MDSFIQNIFSVVLGGLISIITTVIVQIVNFKHERKVNKINQRQNFYDELLTKIPIDTGTNIVARTEYEFKQSISDYWLDKRTTLSCLSKRATLYSTKEVIRILKELYEISQEGYITINLPEEMRKKSNSMVLKIYCDKVDELISIINKEKLY